MPYETANSLPRTVTAVNRAHDSVLHRELSCVLEETIMNDSAADTALRDIQSATNADKLSGAWQTYEPAIAEAPCREALTAAVIREP